MVKAVYVKKATAFELVCAKYESYVAMYTI